MARRSEAKTPWEYVLVTEVINDVGDLNDTERARQVSQRLSFKMHDLIKESEEVEDSRGYMLVSHGVTNVNGNLLLSLIFR